MNSVIFIPAGSSGIPNPGLVTPTDILDTFESFSKNLRTYDYVLNYTGKDLTSIVYTVPSGGTVTKTLNYTGNLLTSIILSGILPAGIDTIKTLTYTGKDLTEITYS